MLLDFAVYEHVYSLTQQMDPVIIDECVWCNKSGSSELKRISLLIC